MPTANSILVTGDLVVDHHIYEGQRRHFGESASAGVTTVAQAGGAALVHDLLSQLVPSIEPKWSVHLSVALPAQPTEYPQIDGAHHAYAFWCPFPAGASAKERYWRVGEAMGFGRTAARRSQKWRPAKVPRQPKIIAISEGGLGFRSARAQWRHLPFDSCRWIVLKTTAPVTDSPLWQHLRRAYCDKLIVIVSAHDLRRSSAPIAFGSSWESTVQDVARALLDGGLQSLQSCRHLLISFDDDGGLWVDMAGPEARGTLVYDAGGIEGEHASVTPGQAFGLLSCLTATTVANLAADIDAPDFVRALERGAAAMHDLREQGHGLVDHQAPNGFPKERLMTLAKNPGHRYTTVSFPLKAALDTDPPWSLLRNSQRGKALALEMASLVVRRGPVALANIPHLRVGKLLAIDRREIEALRTVIATMRAYRDDHGNQRPLSVAVLGPPGAGKSFAVKEIAQNLLGPQAWLEFNLSQFAIGDLLGAFHQVRDRVLQGIVPVAFFDEFDSQQYRWLQYLLAPLQDGRFQEGQLTHTIGKCVFVFAGGTSWTFDTFGPPASGDPAIIQAHRDFELAKGPDFVSRIDVALDVVGPNRRRRPRRPDDDEADVTRTASGQSFTKDSNDVSYPIRRALMIRSELGCAADDKIEIDDELLKTLLERISYRHGSRSLGKLVQPLRRARPGTLSPSFLPPPAQLALHVDDPKGFADLLDKGRPASDRPLPKLTMRAVDRIAAMIHKDYRELAKQLGETVKKELDKPFQRLTPALKETNRRAVARMPAILAIGGLRLRVGKGTKELAAAVQQHLAFHLELLADAEHEGWMAYMHAKDWRYGPRRDDANKLHPCLLPFQQLREADRMKDRNTVRHYPAYVKIIEMHIDFDPADL